MDLTFRDNRKNKGLKGVINSAKYSIEGIKYTLKNEQSVKIILFSIFLAIFLGVVLKINEIEWMFILVAIGLLFGTELINTAIEATIDLLSPDYHPLAKIAKDTGSAAVFIYSCILVTLSGIIFLPKLLILFGLGWW